jgi:hypothetical protein
MLYTTYFEKCPKIPLFRKGNENNCVLNSGYRMYAKIINGRLKTVADAVLLEEQQGFRKRRSTVDNIFVV